MCALPDYQSRPSAAVPVIFVDSGPVFSSPALVLSIPLLFLPGMNRQVPLEESHDSPSHNHLDGKVTRREQLSPSGHFLGQHPSPRSDWGIACLGLGSRWPPNGRQFSLLLYLPRDGIYRYQRSQATRAATPPQRLHQWKHGRSLIDGIYCLDGLGFPISLYSSHFHCLILVIISMYLFGFGKLAAHHDLGHSTLISKAIQYN